MLKLLQGESRMRVATHFLVLAAFVAAPALAQSGPFKLVIAWYQSNLTVIDYPSQARCEQARKAVMIEMEELPAIETLAIGE